MSNPKTLKVKLTRSPIGRLKRHRDCVRGLGLRRIGQIVEVEDTPSTRGMVHQAQHLVQIEEGAE